MTLIFAQMWIGAAAEAAAPPPIYKDNAGPSGWLTQRGLLSMGGGNDVN